MSVLVTEQEEEEEQQEESRILGVGLHVRRVRHVRLHVRRVSFLFHDLTEPYSVQPPRSKLYYKTELDLFLGALEKGPLMNREASL